MAGGGGGVRLSFLLHATAGRANINRARAALRRRSNAIGIDPGVGTGEGQAAAVINQSAV
jgi:hypothetical protein